MFIQAPVEKCKLNESVRVIVIDICGFPKYSCGHNIILLVYGGSHMLAHLGADVPTSLSSTKKLPAWQYWPYAFCTNKLDAKVFVYEGEDVPKKITDLYDNSWVFKCKEWHIDAITAASFKSELIAQDGGRIDNFSFFHSIFGACLTGKGVNCVEWKNNLFAKMGIKGSGSTCSSNDIFNLLKIPAPSTDHYKSY